MLLAEAVYAFFANGGTLCYVGILDDNAVTLTGDATKRSGLAGLTTVHDVNMVAVPVLWDIAQRNPFGVDNSDTRNLQSALDKAADEAQAKAKTAAESAKRAREVEKAVELANAFKVEADDGVATATAAVEDAEARVEAARKDLDEAESAKAKAVEDHTAKSQADDEATAEVKAVQKVQDAVKAVGEKAKAATATSKAEALENAADDVLGAVTAALRAAKRVKGVAEVVTALDDVAAKADDAKKVTQGDVKKAGQAIADAAQEAVKAAEGAVDVATDNAKTANDVCDAALIARRRAEDLVASLGTPLHARQTELEDSRTRLHTAEAERGKALLTAQTAESDADKVLREAVKARGEAVHAEQVRADAARALADSRAPRIRTAAQSLMKDVVAHCHRAGNRLAVLDGPPTPDPLTSAWDAALRDFAGPLGTDDVDKAFGALYYPWVRVPGLDGDSTRAVPPSGHIAGVWASTDAARGVFKAPANVGLRDVGEPLDHLGDARQQPLNDAGVNCLRVFPGQGLLVWGARTLSDTRDWRYVNVRRLVCFLEDSILSSSRWAVFEPNDERLWASLRHAVAAFLTDQWRAGALFGRTAAEAFYVKCDADTHTQTDLDEGRVVCEIGVAPVRPAEFVIFRVTQIAAAVGTTTT
ncbi:phage tail sheath family protein [Embleya hyalina]|uniref:phage tail sheath family protein n=1 Tax=Embleya hyalina TaxID=516124 RepID=UPI00135882AB|nr:phage tail sheath C-terminal domain-containing protein [Embleya hyalina]